MSIIRLWAFVQFRAGSHSLPVEQGKFVRPSLPCHLCRRNLCSTRAVGDELHYIFDCPRFDAIRAQYSNLFQDAAGSMRLFMWHKDQKAVSHCLTAILQMAQTCTQIRPHKPGWLNGRSKISLSPPELPRVSGKHEGSALQGLGWSACVPKNSSLKKGKALHILCMVSASQSAENCTLL